jgi:hypothetical protein
MPPGVLPVLTLGLVLDAIGQMVGYLAGPGDSAAWLAEFEYDRLRHVSDGDRRMLDARRP